MIVLYGLLLIGLIALNLTSKKHFLEYCFFRKKGYVKLKETMQSYGYTYSIQMHLAAIAVLLVLLSFACWQFEVRYESWMTLILLCSFLFPHMLIWMMYHAYQEKVFSGFTLFLQTFIAVFKLNPKTYQALEECRKVCEGEIVDVIDQTLEELTQSGSVEKSLRHLLNYQPHFIVFNLVSLVTTIENHGGIQYLEGLDLIQDDIDDWIEDTYHFKQMQMQAKNRILALCGLSSVIAVFAKNMLEEISFDTQSNIYQFAILLFFAIMLITILLAHHALAKSWFEKEENVCSKT